MEILAFIVLSLPLLAILLIAVLAYVAARAAARRTQVPETKWKYGLIAALMVILIPTWDEIAGRLYFQYLCGTQGGVTILRPTELQPQYWGSNGIPTDRIVREGTRFVTLIGDRFYIETQVQKNHSHVFRIDRDHLFIRDRASDYVLSELVVFRYWGGWLRNHTSLNIIADSCPAPGIGADFYRKTFIKSSPVPARTSAAH